MRAFSTIFSGVKLYSSSISAGRNVPLPLTSFLAAASSDAIVMARILQKCHPQFVNGIPGDANRAFVRSYPPMAAINISPCTKRRPVSFLSPRLFAAAQNVATLVPTIQPDPVICARSLSPFDKLTVTVPSDIQSVSPVIAMIQP